MKLKNKLLPLVGISAVCATVAPIALTSCKNNNGMVDLVAKYKPTITDIPGVDTWTKSKAETTYFANMAANTNIFADDFYFSTSIINQKTNTDADNPESIKEETPAADVTGSVTEQVMDNEANDSRSEANDEDWTIYYLPGTEVSERVTVDNEKISNISFKQFGSDANAFWTVSFTKEFEWHFQSIVNGTAKTKKEDVTTNATQTAWEGNVNTVNDVVDSGTIKFVNMPIALGFDQKNSFWYTYIDLYTDNTDPTTKEDLPYVPSTKLSAIWADDEEASISINVNVDEHLTGKIGTQQQNMSVQCFYDYVIEDAASHAIAVELGLNKESGIFDAFFRYLLQYVCVYQYYSHYLFNVIYGGEQ